MPMIETAETRSAWGK